MNIGREASDTLYGYRSDDKLYGGFSEDYLRTGSYDDRHYGRNDMDDLFSDDADERRRFRLQ